MIDMKKLRENPDLFRRALAAKGIELDLDRLLEVDKAKKEIEKTVVELRTRKNELTDKVKKGLPERAKILKLAKEVDLDLTFWQEKLNETARELEDLKLRVPGLPDDDVAVGGDDKENVELYRRGEIDRDKKRDHLEIAGRRGMLELKTARRIAGARAYALIGEGAHLENALLRFAYDCILRKDFIPVQPPVAVRHEAMEGTGYFPFGEDNAYFLEKDNLYLTGTGEVGILALNADRCFEEGELPLRLFGQTTCFRREAGAHGKDTKGLYRVHQFQKVEQVVICKNDAEEAQQEHKKLLENAEEILAALELPYRVVNCCTAELGLGQARKYDIETWMPGRGDFGETHSCSNFYDFQARRLNIKYIEPEGKKRFVFTLNNTAIATPRILVAFLENHQLENGDIYIPEKLRPYMGGRERI